MQVSLDVTAELNEPEPESADESEVETNVDIDACTQEFGALVLRGNRCVLCKSLEGAWEGMRVPSLPPDDEDDEAPLACALRAVDELCEIDTEEDVMPLPHIQPVSIYMPGGEPAVVTLFALYAANPPPDGPIAHTCTQSHTHTFTDTFTDTCTHMHTQTHTHTDTHMHTHAHTCRQAHAHAHARSDCRRLARSG